MSFLLHTMYKMICALFCTVCMMSLSLQTVHASSSITTDSSCLHCQQAITALTVDERDAQLKKLPHWHYDPIKQEIVRQYHFNNYYDTLAFVNAVAWLAHRSDHHPTLIVRYKDCEVRLSTHEVSNISIRDIHSAKQIDDLIK